MKEKKLKKWWNEHHDDVLSFCRWYAEGYIECCALVYTMMLLTSMFTGRRWTLFKRDK